jgi:N-acetylmuramoyl-L-alanine amidase
VQPALRAGKRALPVGALALALAALAGPGCAIFPCRPPAPARPAPGYERLRDTLAAVDASGLTGRRIALDPGHGGFFRGALGVGGLSEAEVNLAVALALRERLVAHGALVCLTRDGDRDFLSPADSSLSADLAGRARRAAAFDPDLLVSIHHNADPRGAHDVNETQTYYKLGDEGPSLDAAQDVHRALVRNVGIRANRVVPGNYYVLRSSAAPALLTETSYITNPDVEKRLRRSEKQQLEADALFVGLAHYFARKAPVIGTFEAYWPGFEAGNSPFNTGFPALRATVRGSFDRVHMAVDGREVTPLRSGARLDWTPATAIAGGPHRATLQVALAGEGSSREWSVEFRVALAPGSISASFPEQPIWDGRQPLGLELRAFDEAGSVFADSLTVRVRAHGNVELTPADTVVTIAGGTGWAYFRDGRILPLDPSGRRVLRTPMPWGQPQFEVEEYPPSVRAEDGQDSTPLFTARAGLPVGDEPVAPFRTGFALCMPEGVPLRDAPGTSGPDPALRWINRDGFVRLPRDSAGAVHVPALAGFRSWPADSAFPPRFVALCGGVLHRRRILLDPEGGGGDAAGQGPGGTRAATLNLASARILAGFLEAAGAEVRLTREGDLALSDVERVQIAESFHAERYLRLAHPAAPPRLGAYPTSVAGRAWAARTAATLAAFGLPAPPVTDEAQYAIQQTSCPALLAAPGSLADEASEARLLAPGALRAEAYALFLALAREWAPNAAWPADSLTVLGDDAHPLADAAVTLGGALVLVTDASGRIRFARSEPGPIEAVVEDSRLSARATLLESQRGAVLAGTTGR